ncbi:MAG: glycosyltransferase [Lutibacter sp.]
MVSILIPVYNYDANLLVKKLFLQAEKLNIPYEIIVMDDASERYLIQNRQITSLKNVSFIELKKNVGRSKIRNKLASLAKFNWLLFLDVDVLPKSDLFLKKYVNLFNENKFKVFSGGVCYEKKKPEKSKVLRWVYGKNREEVSLSTRKNRVYSYLFGGNFATHKSIFTKIHFNENLVKYGYEDLLFAQQLKEINIEIQQIENEVFHLGLISSSSYLIQVRESIENLIFIESLNLNMINSKLLNWFRGISKLHLIVVVAFLFNRIEPLLERNLKSNYPMLKLLDFYKLGYLCKLKSEKS